MEFEKLKKIVAEVLIEEEFDIEIPQEVAENITSVADAVEQIKNATN